jgi:hypothetical protein
MDDESYLEIDKFGNKIWRNKDGELHRIDGPAIEYSDGDKFWFQNGEYHRLDGPAIEYSNGDKVWSKNGKKHRIDGPAVEFNDLEIIEWWVDGLKHRLDGPAYINKLDGEKEWYINGLLCENKEDFFERMTEEQKLSALMSIDFLLS